MLAFLQLPDDLRPKRFEPGEQRAVGAVADAKPNRARTVFAAERAIDEVFARLISSTNGLQILGSDWNTEGIGGETENGTGIFWVSGFPKGYAGLDPATIYNEISTTTNMDKAQAMLATWQKYLVESGGQSDPLSFVVVAVAPKESEAREIVNALIMVIRSDVL